MSTLGWIRGRWPCSLSHPLCRHPLCHSSSSSLVACRVAMCRVVRRVRITALVSNRHCSCPPPALLALSRPRAPRLAGPGCRRLAHLHPHPPRLLILVVVVLARPRRSSSVLRPSFVLPFVLSFFRCSPCSSSYLSSRRSSCCSLSSPSAVWGGCEYFEWAGCFSNWAHIPQERGGAPFVANARRWVEVEEVGSMWW